jgi:catechol 2,3-dioxygenase-like lactoylglutathione lyase family enzyme
VITSGLHHVAVCVDDLEAALDFYVRGLGFELLDTRPDFPFAGAWLQAGAHQVHLMVLADQPRGGAQHVAFHVDDLDAAVAALATRGISARRAVKVPGAGSQAFLHDPAGNQIELNQPDVSDP